MEEKVHTDLALFCKGDLYALLALTTTHEEGAILRFDGRDAEPTIIVFDNAFSAISGFDKSVDSSIKNGWKCFHRGKPNIG